MFYSTQYFHLYCPNSNGYIGQFLRWGADCVSGCLIGMMLTKTKDYSIIHKILPLECVALTPFMAFATVSLGATQGQMQLDGGMNYQTVAYAMAELFGISFFYSFIYKGLELGNLKKLIMLVFLFIQAACCAMAGGRGGLVLLVVYVCYLSFLMVKNNIVSKRNFIVIAIVSVVGFFVVADCLGVFNSSGFERSSNSLNNDDRFEVWSEYWKFIDDYPIFGYGLGGDYFTVGFYSHNMIVDFLLELGIVGLLVMISIFFKTYKKVYFLTKQNPVFIIVMILFIYGMVMNMFSGYWISMNTNWLCFGVAMTSMNYFKIHNE
jgi:O-antigen ligase